jgi:LPXTG-motif cell wall-anchored protein
LCIGWQGSESLGDQVTETITGRFTDETMWYLIGGAAALAAGAYLTFFKR